MSKNSELIEVEGRVIDVLPGQTYKVQLENNFEVICYTGGRLRKNKIRIILGDKVRIEMTPYDLTKGRISYRL
jgi:translation initiation factor IF-1|tara:strand:- start:572 stop:790 length:219 start_codon:yes stop_codon:yes gene_type:complete